MLLINQRQLEISAATADDKHPLHAQAIEYTKGLEELRQKFGKTIKFVRPGFPKTSLGSDSKGRDANIQEPTPPIRIPLRTVIAHPTRGREIWACPMDFPELKPNNLWDIGRKVSIQITDFIITDLNKDPDLAYYLYYISNSVKRGRLKVDNPKEEVAKKADKVREELERKTAVWQMLTDEDVLRKMAAAYGVTDAHKRDANELRFALEATLENNDKNKRKDPLLKGTKEFLDEMKVTDAVRLRAFIRKLMDEQKLIYKPDGRFWVGSKNIMQVPASAINDRFNYLCNYYSAPNNTDKLQELMRDVVTKDYLDSLKDDKEFKWLSKVMGIQSAFKKGEDIKSMVYDAFNVAL